MRTAPEHLRPEHAAKHFGVSQSTLSRWAAAELIGSAKIDGVRFYVASDIADVIARAVTPRRVVPISAPDAPTGGGDWRSDPFWADAPTAPRARTAAP